VGYVAAVVVVFALIVAGALALGGDDEDARDVASEQSTERAATPEPEQTETAAEPEDESAADDSGSSTAEEPAESDRGPDPAPTPDPAPQPARYTPYSASTGDWQAELPAGNGWQAPAERQLGGGRRNRVTVRGPGEAVVLIDHTPSAAARFGSKYRSRQELSQPWFGSMTEYRLGDDSVGYVLNGSESGPGFRVFAIGVSPVVARRVADSLTFVDL
jgi:hypothetical protein